MVSEAEKYKAEDDANRNRIESKNGLENYCYSLKGSISGDEVAAKMDPADKTALEGKIEETISSRLESSGRKRGIRRKAKGTRRCCDAHSPKDGWRSTRRHARWYARWYARWNA